MNHWLRCLRRLCLSGKPLPSMARHYTTSLSPSAFCPLPFAQQRGGLGRGWLLGLSGIASCAVCVRLESPCRAWLGTTPPHLRRALSARSLLRSKGEGWGGVGFWAFQAQSCPHPNPRSAPRPLRWRKFVQQGHKPMVCKRPSFTPQAGEGLKKQKAPFGAFCSQLPCPVTAAAGRRSWPAACG